MLETRTEIRTDLQSSKILFGFVTKMEGPVCWWVKPKAAQIDNGGDYKKLAIKTSKKSATKTSFTIKNSSSAGCNCIFSDLHLCFTYFFVFVGHLSQLRFEILWLYVPTAGKSIKNAVTKSITE